MTSKKKKKNIKNNNSIQLALLVLLFLLASATAAAGFYYEYQSRPGNLEYIRIEDRTSEKITVAWNRVKNVSKYVVTYNGETLEVSGRKKSVTITGLTPDTEYQIYVRADSRKREGLEILEERTRTKKTQEIQGVDSLLRFGNRPVTLTMTAETPITYSSKDKSVQIDGSTVVFTKPGDFTVTANAQETEDYDPASKDIKVSVLDTVAVEPAGAEPHVFYKLDSSNCECVMEIMGTDDVTLPQSFVRDQGKYVISYVKEDRQRIITFGSDKKVVEPKMNLGHSNGLTIVDGKYYSISGESPDSVIIDPATDEYTPFVLKYECTGIAFDPVTNMFYTSSRRMLAAYAKDFTPEATMDVIKHKEKHPTQDSGAYGGILMQCLSDKSFHGINYIDFYDMVNKKYMGSVQCDLSEVESLLVDEEGYIQLLCNTPTRSDYIWKTPINMKQLCD